MKDVYSKYEIVIGLEVHAQLATKTKLFCRDVFEFGAAPNTNVSPISLAHPGTLPMLNREAITFAIKMGLACHCKINPVSYFARKHYNYPDLSKGYQLTQHTEPICIGGYVYIEVDGYEKNIPLNHIHLEEDAGKSVHDKMDNYSVVDYNRAGAPLIEIVSLPEIKSANEAVAYMSNIQHIVRYLKICDGDMEKGNLRCDVNISVKKKEDKNLGTKVEIKNLNSLRSIKRAIEYEAQRQIKMLESKAIIQQQTRGFDVEKGITYNLRNKENANDYRYFNEPDLMPLVVEEEEILTINKSIPELHFVKEKRYIKEYKLSVTHSKALTEERKVATFFEQIILYTKNYQAACNWILGPIKNYLNLQQKNIKDFPIAPIFIAEIIELIDQNKVNYTDASTTLFNALFTHTKYAKVIDVALELNLIQEKNTDLRELEQIINRVIEQYPQQVKEYKFDGKKGLIGFFVGEIMKNLKQKIDPKKVNEEVKKALQ